MESMWHERIDEANYEYSTGTTIMAVEFENGVVIGAESRNVFKSNSLKDYVYVSNRVANKIHKIAENIYCCCSGDSAVTQNVTRHVIRDLGLKTVHDGEVAKVKTAAYLFQSHSDNRNGYIIAGWDPSLEFQVYNVSNGCLIREPFAIDGSGATNIFGFVNNRHKTLINSLNLYDRPESSKQTHRTGLSKKDAEQLVKDSLSQAVSNDLNSGGVIRIGIISETKIFTTAYRYDQETGALYELKKSYNKNESRFN